ncbi:MAG: SPFH domain-containing protein [Spirochaetes bacterium]|nr:SPFH domain-containing protein [Spirochaetota bacterium]MBN2771295.1 SPFH domain-containing protein [Spirochaetota bacterium]
MFGFKFIKFQPTDYVLRYKNGKIVKEGLGLSFFYYAPRTSLVSVPIGSAEVPFIFEEVTTDYQTITIQGTVTYKIAEPKKIAEYLNFTLDNTGSSYLSDDPQKLPQRIINAVHVLTKKEMQNLSLREAIRSSEALVDSVYQGLGKSTEITSLGIKVLGISILAIKPNKETARALEAEAREQILKEADDAIYTRRNSSVEQERKIKENELNTEIAIENKKRQIKETQMEAEKSVQQKKHELQQSEMLFSIQQEDEKKNLVLIAVQNARAEADASAYAISAMMKAFEGADTGVIQALASTGMNPQQLIALAFQGLAEKADKIGQLNISPELLNEILKKSDRK